MKDRVLGGDSLSAADRLGETGDAAGDLCKSTKGEDRSSGVLSGLFTWCNNSGAGLDANRRSARSLSELRTCSTASPACA